MRVANVSGRAGILRGDTVIDVEKASSGRFSADLADLYRDWSAFVDWSATVADESGDPFDPADLGPPSPRPAQVFAIGMNYFDHAAEVGIPAPESPSVFTKYPSCLTGPFDDVALVEGHCDWEVEMVVVIGIEGHQVPRGGGWSHVAGVTVGQDLSERIGQTAGPVPQFSLGKSHPGFGPTGPYLVTVDELPDRDSLALTCDVNGVRVQDGSTSELVFTVDELVHRLSAVVTLQPGDLIFTGTPAGVGAGRSPQKFLAAGDVVESWVEGIGTIRNIMA